MSHEEESILDDTSEATGSTLKTDYSDEQLQIVELAPYTTKEDSTSIELVAEGSESSDEGLKYVQLETSKNMLVDYINLSLVRCENGQEEYRLISNSDSSTTVTCVLADEGELEGDDQENGESYVMVDGEEGPLVFLQSTLQQANVTPKAEKKAPKKALTPAEILEKAKALQKAKSLICTTVKRGPGRRRKSDLPPPHELLTSPQFKLFLYSCKFCSFRCNAIKELTAHKTAEHGAGRASRGGGRGPAAVTQLQCARCPFRGHSHSQLMRHVKEKHLETTFTDAQTLLESNPEVQSADVLVCGACGYESSCKTTFKEHIEDVHGAISC